MVVHVGQKVTIRNMDRNSYIDYFMERQTLRDSSQALGIIEMWWLQDKCTFGKSFIVSSFEDSTWMRTWGIPSFTFRDESTSRALPIDFIHTIEDIKNAIKEILE